MVTDQQPDALLDFDNLYFDATGINVTDPTGGRLAGDADGDGSVDLADFGILRSRFGADPTRGFDDADFVGRANVAVRQERL